MVWVGSVNDGLTPGSFISLGSETGMVRNTVRELTFFFDCRKAIVGS